jgi:hypothetical protein
MEQGVPKRWYLNYRHRGEAQAIFGAKTFNVQYPTFSTTVTLHTYSPIKMEQGVPKRWYLNYRRRGITQKEAYDKSILLVIYVMFGISSFIEISYMF